MKGGRRLSGDEMKALLAEVAEVMDPTGPQHTLIIAGGSLLAMRGLRGTSEDVDSVRASRCRS
jgi:hypothetical protein